MNADEKWSQQKTSMYAFQVLLSKIERRVSELNYTLLYDYTHLYTSAFVKNSLKNKTPQSKVMLNLYVSEHMNDLLTNGIQRHS